MSPSRIFVSDAHSLIVHFTKNGVDKSFQFENGQLRISDPERIAEFEEALKSMSSGARAMIREVDRGAAEKLAREHMRQQQNRAHSGTMHSEAMTANAAALAKRDANLAAQGVNLQQADVVNENLLLTEQAVQEQIKNNQQSSTDKPAAPEKPAFKFNLSQAAQGSQGK